MSVCWNANIIQLSFCCKKNLLKYLKMACGTVLGRFLRQKENLAIKMPFKHLKFANNCCIFAVQNRFAVAGLGSSMDRISLS